MVPDEKLKNGAFYFDRMEAAKHISFSWTEYSKAQVRVHAQLLGSRGQGKRRASSRKWPSACRSRNS